MVAVARTVGGLEELDDAVREAGSSATLVPLDMRDYAGLYRLAAALNERYQRLDVLVGNAAIGRSRSPLGHVDAEAWDEAMAVNVTANWHLIRAMDPLLRRSEAGRAVFMTSGAATMPAPMPAPIRCRRPRSMRWREPTRRKRVRRRCASICSIPARRARACAR